MLPKLQHAAEVSFDRLIANLRNFSLASFARQRLGTIALHFAIALGLPIKQSVIEANNQDDDLVGPLLVCLFYGGMVCWGQSLAVLALVFATWFFGSLLVFLLFRMLGSSHGFLHVANTVGYSLAPLVVLQPLMTLTEDVLPWFSFSIKCFAVLFASRSASLILVQTSTEKKVFLFELPLFLLYVYLLGFRSGA